jgi:hypothetical protein
MPYGEWEPSHREHSDEEIQRIVNDIRNHISDNNMDDAKTLYKNTKNDFLTNNQYLDLAYLNTQLGDRITPQGFRTTGGKRKSKKMRKWRTSYKKRIDCNRPKGFSQKQYCKYGIKNN